MTTKIRKRFIKTTHRRTDRIRVHGNHRNSRSCTPLPKFTPAQFEELFAQVGSLAKMAEHLHIGPQRLYQLAHSLFPGRRWRSGPGRKFVVERKDAQVTVADGKPLQVYTIRQPDQIPEAAVTVLWDGQAAHCQLCVSALRENSSSCTHARSLRRYILEGRTEQKALQPCPQCPWIQKGQPDLTPEVRQAAIDGRWFCCHINMGTCIGAANYGNAERKRT